MNANFQDFKYEDLTEKIIKIFYEVYNKLGYGFLEKVMVELKATKCLVEENEAQLLNYLRATEIEVGLLFNFGPKPEIRRKAFDNSRK